MDNSFNRVKSTLTFLALQDHIVSNLINHTRINLGYVNDSLIELNEVNDLEDHPLSRVNLSELFNSIVQQGVIDGTVEVSTYICIKPILSRLDINLCGLSSLDANDHYDESKWISMNAHLASKVVCRCKTRCH